MSTPRGMTNQALLVAQEFGALRVSDLRARGIHPEALRRLVGRGLVERLGPDLYRAAEAPITENHGLVLAAQTVPRGVVCLLSALRFHWLTTELPSEVWMALDRRAAKPRAPYPRLQIVRFSGPALTEGVETHLLEGVAVHVYGPAKTVVDCFKYRHKLGVNVAVEALRDYLARPNRDIEELLRLARACRMANVMQPYLEALL
jgi:predicted transcriptional regulator of viral defense system